MPVVVELTSILEPIRLEALFAVQQPLELELGSGDGGFLVEWAAREPSHNFIGVERLLGRLRKIERKASRRGLANLRAVRIEAGYFVRYLVPEGSVCALHVYFPDPWPKRRHWRHRLVNEGFPAMAERVLTSGGRVYLRTDHAEYFDQMQRVFEAHGGYARQETPAALAAVPTDFERAFRAAGSAVFHAAYARTGAALR
jgi:tRNA (guanine-N7-)-methyltransferase